MRLKVFLFISSLIFLFCGCVSQNSQIDDISKINSFRDYVIQKRSNETGNYDLVATIGNKTLLELRVYNESTYTTDATDILKALDDAKIYCSAKNGKIIYGDSSITLIKNLPTAFSLDYIEYKNEMQKQGNGKYEGFFKCTNSSDDFEIEYMVDNVDLKREHMLGGGYIQTYSRYFLIKHQKLQTSNEKTWERSSKYTNYTKDKSIKEILTLENNTSNWKYEKIVGAYKYCTFNNGIFYVRNQVTKNRPLLMDEYLFQRVNSMQQSQKQCIEDKKQGNGCYSIFHFNFTNNDLFYCVNQKNRNMEFTIEHQNDLLFYKNSLENF